MKHRVEDAPEGASQAGATTPFDTRVRTHTSRYHLVIQAAQKMAARNPKVGARRR